MTEEIEQRSSTLSGTVIYIIIICEASVAVLLLINQITKKLNRNLRVFYICLLIHCFFLIGFLTYPFIQRQRTVFLILYFIGSILLENSVNFMIFE